MSLFYNVSSFALLDSLFEEYNKKHICDSCCLTKQKENGSISNPSSYVQTFPLILQYFTFLLLSYLFIVLSCFNTSFSSQRQLSQGVATPQVPPVRNCLQMAACSSNELLPMVPDLPADLFTACLTTPMKVALKWFVYHLMNNHFYQF